MANTKKKKEMSAGCRKLIESVSEQYPNPYFCDEDEMKFFTELKKEFPDASKHENTGIGNVICKDKMSRIVLAYEMIGASKAYAYMASSIMLDSFDLETEGIFLLNNRIREEV